ncbi:MAG: phosphoribosylamine--glycine ligase [Bacteroidales bacterium]
MNVLLIGNGGREHALAWKIAQSSLCSRLFVAPGNPGTAELGTNVSLNINDIESVARFISHEKIEMVVVGPEAPLAAGFVDKLQTQPELKELAIVGPSLAGARLEASKDFAKAFMQRHGIPTAAYRSFSAEQLPNALEFLKTLHPPYVLKADGLAAGKGVIITADLEKAEEELRNMLIGRRFGEASARVVIEEFLQGIELSVFVLTDGKNYVILPEAKDYKRIGEDDTGPNTGGMGAVSPVPFANSLFMEKVEQRIIRPTVEGLAAEGIPYTGFIFLGLMNVEGNPFVIEYNVRMGDPETEVVMPRLGSDLVEMMWKAARKELKDYSVKIRPETAACVMLVSGGYPGDYTTGFEISGIEKVEGCNLFYAGTRLKDNKLVTSGGRVLAISALGSHLREALDQAYQNAEKIDFDGKYYRRDIGKDLLNA